MPQNINKLSVSSPSTVYISFTGEMPKLFLVYSGKGVVEYFRYLDGKTPRMKFNLVSTDDYTCNVPCEIIKIVPVEIPDLPRLPPAERDRLKGEPDVVYDPSWTVSPASNFTNENTIVCGPAWAALIPPVRLFILLHEQGHFFYMTEEYCDLFAFVSFMRMGYNKSTAYYTLSKVLRKSPQTVARIKTLLQTIQTADGPFQPE